MKHRLLVTATLLVCSVTAATAQDPPPPRNPGHLVGHQPVDHSFGDQLFPPELVMQFQVRLGITTEQRTAITAAIKDLQSRIVDMQWQMQDETQKLNELLSRQPVEVAPAMTQVDRVFDLERSVKRAHLEALIRIKNVLTKEQQETLKRLKVEHARHHDPGQRR